MDPLKQLTVEEVKELFSKTEEYTVIDEGKTIRIQYTRGGKSMNSASILLRSLNFQQIIRGVHELAVRYNK